MATFLGSMVRGAADEAVAVQSSNDSPVGSGTAVVADGEEMGFIIRVVYGVGATNVVDTEGSERRFEYGKFSFRLLSLHRLRSFGNGQAVCKG